MYMMVAVVDDPEKGIDLDNFILYRGDGTRCKHLVGNKVGEYSCAIHDYPWYKETPCAAHTQIEEDLSNPCRMGEYLVKLEEINLVY